MPSKAPIHHHPQLPTVLWDVTTVCNYRCTYCYSELLQHRAEREAPVSVASMAEAFRVHLAGWVINFTGGEPFVFPDLPDLAAALAATHTMGIYTNLSLPRPVRRFADRVPPDRVRFVNCGFHVIDRAQHDPDFSSFFQLYTLLVARGFPVSVTYIVHPVNVDRCRDDLRRLEDTGVRPNVKLFRGVHDGCSYPEGFGDDVIAICGDYECETLRGHAVRSQMSGEGGTCKAGMLFLELSSNGDAFRCGTDRSLARDPLGNLFDGTLRLHGRPEVCRSAVCLSCRQGMGYSVAGFRDLG